MERTVPVWTDKLLAAFTDWRTIVAAAIAAVLIVALIVGIALSFVAQSRVAKSPASESPPEQAAAPKPYADPIHGFFEVVPPPNAKIAEKTDNRVMKLPPGSPHAGEMVPCSRVTFQLGKTSISVVARKTFQAEMDEGTLEEVIGNIRRGFPDVEVKEKRTTTVDGVKAAEAVFMVKGYQNHTVKFKKYGLDHVISFTCPAPDHAAQRDQFLAFLRTYHSQDLTPKAAAKTAPDKSSRDVATEEADTGDKGPTVQLAANCVMSAPVEWQKAWTFQQAEYEASSVSATLSPTGDVVALRERSNLRFLDAATGQQLCTLGADVSLLASDFSRDGHLFAAACGAHQIKVWDAQTAELLKTLDAAEGEGIGSVFFSPNGELLAAAIKHPRVFVHNDLKIPYSVSVWNLSTGETLSFSPTGSEADFHPNGQVLAIATLYDEGVALWDIRSSKKPTRILAVPHNRVLAIGFSPDGRLLAFRCYGQTVIWDVASNKQSPGYAEQFVVEMLRERVYGDPNDLKLTSAEAVAASCWMTSAASAPRDIVRQAKGMDARECRKQRGLTFLAATQIFVGDDEEKVREVVRVSPEYAGLFVVECVLGAMGEGPTLAPDLPVPLRNLHAAGGKRVELARRVARAFRQCHGYGWLMAAAEMAESPGQTADMDHIRAGIGLLASPTKTDKARLSRFVMTSPKQGYYTAALNAAKRDPKAEATFEGLDARDLAARDIELATGQRPSLQDVEIAPLRAPGKKALAEEHLNRADSVAAQKLKMAKQLIKVNPAAARKRLQEIVADHKGSEAAVEAQQLLGSTPEPKE